MSHCCLHRYTWTLDEYDWVLHMDVDCLMYVLGGLLLLLESIYEPGCYTECSERFLVTTSRQLTLCYIHTHITRHKNMDDLLDLEKDLVYTKDVGMGGGENALVQGGFILAKPNRTVFNDILDIFKRGNFDGGGWEKSRVGYAWGGATVQGLVAYYFYKVADPSRSYNANMCIWNNMGDKSCANNATDIRNSHFTVCQKPWTCHKARTPACIISTDRWWEMYRHVEQLKGQVPKGRCEGGYKSLYKV